MLASQEQSNIPKIKQEIKPKIDNANQNKIEYFYQCIDWPNKMEHNVNYDLTFVKSYIENYNENKLFEYLDIQHCDIVMSIF